MNSEWRTSLLIAEKKIDGNEKISPEKLFLPALNSMCRSTPKILGSTPSPEWHVSKQ